VEDERGDYCLRQGVYCLVVDSKGLGKNCGTA